MILGIITIALAIAGIIIGVGKWLGHATGAGTTPALSGSAETEFSAEVVRVTQILPHPNADRLEIVRFEMKGLGEAAYEVVCQKDDFQVGSLAAYLSVDCILPTHHPEFQFLTTRLDGAGKTHYRLKAARLRGVFSQGLLVPVPKHPAGGFNLFDFGDSVAEHYGITYHVTATEDPRGPTAATKAPAVQPFPIYGVDSLKKNPRLFQEGDLVLVTEKIHGTNFRFGWVRRRLLGIPVGWKFVVGSHRCIKDGSPRGFYKEDLWTEAAEKLGLADKTRDRRGYTFYGELYGYTYSGQRIQDLTYGRVPTDGPGIALFDIRGPKGWLSETDRGELLEEMNLPEVPRLGVREYSSDLIKSLAEGSSRLASGQIREGVVVEAIASPRRKAKFVGQGYLMRKEVA